MTTPGDGREHARERVPLTPLGGGGDEGSAPSLAGRRDAKNARERRQRISNELALLALAAPALPKLIDEATRLVAEALAVPLCVLMEPAANNARTLVVRSAVVPGPSSPVGAMLGVNLDSQAGYTLLANRPVASHNHSSDVRFQPSPLLKGHGAVAGVTAVIPDGGAEEKPYGVLGAYATHERHFSEEETDFIVTAAAILGTALKRGRDATRARLTEDRLSFLLRANAVLPAAGRAQEILEAAGNLAVPFLADWSFVDIIDHTPKEGPRVHRHLAHPSSPQNLDIARQLKERYPPAAASTGGTPQMLRSGGNPQLLEEVTDDYLRGVARDAQHLELLRAMDCRSYMCVPLCVHYNLLGAVGFLTTAESGRRYSEEDLEMAMALAGATALAIQNAERGLSQARLSREIIHSSPTGADFTPVPRVQAPSTPQGVPSTPATPCLPTAAAEAVRADSPLTRRQAQVLRRASQGSCHVEIGRELSISPRTVEKHLANALSALKVRTLQAAVHKARDLGVLP